MSFLKLQGIGKTYPLGVVALRDVSLEVSAGERLVLLGPSGAGKSTLLRIMAGLENATTGRVLLDHRELTNLPPHQRGLGILTQHPALYPNLTVQENITLDRYPLNDRAVDILKLARLLKRFPSELSGGERQRVALARLAARPHRLWLLDEPFHGLDPSLRAEIRQDLLLLNQELHVTMILVTHDTAEAWSWGLRVGVLASGQLLEVGTTSDLAAQPKFLQTWKALQLGATVDGLVVGGEQAEFISSCGTIRGPSPCGPYHRDGSTYLTLGIRPEDVELLSPVDATQVEGLIQHDWPIILVEPVGRGQVLTLAKANCLVKVWSQAHAPPPVGHHTHWRLPLASALWFDSHTGARWFPPSSQR